MIKSEHIFSSSYTSTLQWLPKIWNFGVFNPRLDIYSVLWGLWFGVSCLFPRGKKEKSNSKKTPLITSFGPNIGLSRTICFFVCFKYLKVIVISEF